METKRVKQLPKGARFVGYYDAGIRQYVSKSGINYFVKTNYSFGKKHTVIERSI